MKVKIAALFVAALLSATSMAEVDIDRLEESIETLRVYEYGKSRGIDLNWVEQQIGLASVDGAVRTRVEDAVIASLAEAKTNDAKQFLCRQLVTIGSARCVPQLASMLTDAEMSHMARYALGRVEAPEAGEALHEALDNTTGKTKAGVINTLVQSDYTAAATDIVGLVNDPDDDVAIAAIRGAGRFGGKPAVTVLRGMRPSATEDIQVEIDSALLNCARGLIQDGDKAAAAEIYREYHTGEYPEHLRTAGLQGLVEVSGSGAIAILLEAIKGEDPDIRRNAVMMMASIKGSETTAAFIDLVESAPVDAQELIVRSFAARGDVSAVPVILELTMSNDRNVRQASFEALGDIGGPEAIPSLAKAAASARGPEREIARSSLVRMRGKGIDKAFIQQANRGDSDIRLEVIRAIGLRMDYEPFATLQDLATTDEDRDIRREAIISMGRIGKPSDLDKIVGLAIAPRSPKDRDAVLRAVGIVFNEMHDASAQAEPVLAALKTASDAARASLLILLSTPATSDALDAVSSAVASSNSEVSDAAIRALGEWPNPAPVEQLYQIATESDNEIHKILALRGYIRLAPLTSDPTKSYVNALKLATRDDEIRMILGGLHHAGTRKAFDIALSYADNPTFEAEACSAVVKVASVYCWREPAKVKAVLEKIVVDAPTDGTRNQARDVLVTMEKCKNVIATWAGTKAFTIPEVADVDRVFSTVFPPEEDFDSEDIVWKMVVPAFEGGGKLDLDKTYGSIDYCCAYLRTTIISPVDQRAKLKWRVDDRIKGWLNGKPVNEGLIRLNKGANTFIVKVGDHGGGWSFSCEILNRDESPMKGLRFER